MQQWQQWFKQGSRVAKHNRCVCYIPTHWAGNLQYVEGYLQAGVSLSMHAKANDNPFQVILP